MLRSLIVKKWALLIIYCNSTLAYRQLKTQKAFARIIPKTKKPLKIQPLVLFFVLYLRHSIYHFFSLIANILNQD